MITLPSAILEHLAHEFLEPRSPAYVLLDPEHKVLELAGNLALYGIRDLRRGERLGLQLQYLEDYLRSANFNGRLLLVETGSGVYADIYFYRAADQLSVIFLDATEAQSRAQLLHQTANDLSLLRHAHTKLLERSRPQSPAERARDGDMMDILKSLFGAMDIVAIERVGAGHYQVIGSLPGWFVRLYPEVVLEKDRLEFSGRFPFLENYLIDAEKFWKSGEAGSRLRSGVWIETDAFGTERQLEATALNVGERKILLIEFPRMEFEEKQQLIQTGREQKLGMRVQSKANRALQKIEKRYQALISVLESRAFLFNHEGVCIDPIGDSTVARPSRFAGKHISEIFGEALANRLLPLGKSVLSIQETESFRWEKEEAGHTRVYQAQVTRSGPKEFLIVITNS